MNKQAVYGIIGIVGILSIIAVGYSYQSFLFDHKEGISIMIQKTHEPLYDENNQEYPTYQFKEEDYDKVPKIKYMMDFLLTTEYAMVDREKFTHHGDDNMKYEIRASVNNISMQVGMPSFEIAIYNKWANSKSASLVEYEEVIFHVLNFKKSH